MEVKKVAEEWEIWDEKGEVVKSEKKMKKCHIPNSKTCPRHV